MTAPPSPSRSSTSLSPNVAAAVAYLLGAVTGIIFLVIEKESRFVRFHAMQSTIVFLGVFVVHLALLGLPVVGRVLYVPFMIGVVALWAVLMIKAFRGEMYKLPYIGEIVEHQLR